MTEKQKSKFDLQHCTEPRAPGTVTLTISELSNPPSREITAAQAGSLPKCLMQQRRGRFYTFEGAIPLLEETTGETIVRDSPTLCVGKPGISRRQRVRDVTVRQVSSDAARAIDEVNRQIGGQALHGPGKHR
jgi:hypothetical protein